MKYFLTAIWVIICVGVLAFSHVQWNQKTAAVNADEPVTQDSNVIDIEPYMSLAANWPEAAKAQLQVALEEEKQFKILFVGSTAMEWENSVTQSLSDSFGRDKISTVHYTYDLTTKDIVAENKQLELAAEKAQLVVIEPFLFNDNGKVKIDITLANVKKMMEEMKAANPETTFILQPSYPIYLPNYYSIQVEALKEFAAENNITYLDHWTAWPATDNPKIKDYLNGQDSPNEKGYQVWAQYLVEYFVNKKAN
ncbi:SGNH/GDSL hydrolase family protein [Neobacillus vireti]|uniref:SGNH/GDSL hydrolase family protein n=1 Tax=Neobacillus vireti TaxID=220686 RepID=UPI0030009815